MTALPSTEDLARLAALRAKVTDEDLNDDGRYFLDDGAYNDLTSCGHGDTGKFNNRADGRAIAILWNFWRAGGLDALIREVLDRRKVEGKVYRDIGILLTQIDWLQECLGETLEAEDAAIVAQIRAEWAATPATEASHD